MNKSVMTAIFATGLAAAGWVGWGFIGHSPLALAMTVMIAATYLMGAWELMRYRAATVSLTRALDTALASMASNISRRQTATRLRAESSRKLLVLRLPLRLSLAICQKARRRNCSQRPTSAT